ncbi:MAG TPA: hypothetical protein VGM50_21190, partial [Gemmatimonadaceae bacterium]
MRVRSSRSFSLILAAIAALVFVPRAHAQGSGSNEGITPGDYLRLSAGVTNPVSAQGNLRDWGSGTTYNLTWDNWGSGSQGTDLTGFGFGVGYTLLPFKSSFFVQNFVPTQVTGSTATATAASAGVFEALADFRVRIPSPIVMPFITIGLGFMNWHPGTIHYT